MNRHRTLINHYLPCITHEPSPALCSVVVAMSALALLMATAPAGSRFSARLGRLVAELQEVGPQRLMVFTDFDQTCLGAVGGWWGRW